MDLLINYLLPALMLVVVLGYIVLKVRWNGGPAGLMAVFFAAAFLPSILYALIADESSTALFAVSLIFAAAVTGILALRMHRK